MNWRAIAGRSFCLRLVPRTRSSHHNRRESGCELRVQSGTRIIELLVSFDSEVRSGAGRKLGRTPESGHCRAQDCAPALPYARVTAMGRSAATAILFKALAALAFLFFSNATGIMAQTTSPAIVKELAPTGKLRAAINFGNPVLAQKDPATGEARGVSVDLAREVARRADVPLELVPYDAAGKVTGDATSNRWD